MEITGHTRIWAILADPIGHVRTPQALNKLMERLGLNGVMIPVHVGAQDLATVVQGLRHTRNLGGFVVTVPHKAAIVALCDEVSTAAAAIAAVNVVRREADGRLVGGILDGIGFVTGLRQAGIDMTRRSTYLVGAGGAANAIAFALAEAGVGSLTLSNRTTSKSVDLAARLAKFFPSLPVRLGTHDPSGHDIVVNATSLGLRPGDSLPLDVERLQPGQIVAEILMEPAMTPLLVEAQGRGCAIHTGSPMLECQLNLMAEFMGMVFPRPAVGE